MTNNTTSGPDYRLPSGGGLNTRGRAFWQNYRGLRQAGRHSAMSWWTFKILQGLLFGGLLIAFAIILIALNFMTADSVFLTRLGMGIAILGMFVFVRYLAAPTSAKWIVTVPENWYYVVEDADGYTIEYLEPGRMIVPWRWGSRIVEYVNFNAITVTELIEDALGSDTLPVDIEVTVNMRFNPVKADPDLYPTLRRMNTQDVFEELIARDVRDIVYRYLSSIATIQGQRELLANIESVETVIGEELASAEPLGLTLAPNRPVTVRVRVPPKVRDAYQSLWERGQRVREGSKILVEIKALADELKIPYEEAFQLFYLMQTGTELDTTGKRRTGTQPVVVLQTNRPPIPEAPRVVPPVTVPPAEPTAEHRMPPEPAPAPAETGPTIARLIEDAERAPDPMDLRRQRRDERRSRRA